MLAYRFDENTKEYLGTQTAQIDPLEGGYLLPANCTFLKVPKYQEGQIPVFENDIWVVKVDNRGKWQVKLDDVTFSKVDYVGEKAGYQVISDEVYEDYMADNDKYAVVDGVFIDVSDTEEYKEKKRQEEKERINGLSMTRSDFFDNTIKAWGTDDEELLPIIKGILETLGVSDLEKKIAVNNYNNALNFYRKHTLFTLLSGIPIPVGDIIVNVSSDKWDSFFDKVNKRDPDAYKELLPSQK